MPVSVISRFAFTAPILPLCSSTRRAVMLGSLMSPNSIPPALPDRSRPWPSWRFTASEKVMAICPRRL
ncbi:hypothetical protein D3C76_1009450 [compost metagenome]